MKYALICLLLAGMAAGQTAKKKPIAPKPNATQELIDVLKSDLERERAKTADLEKQLADANKKYADSIAILDTLNTQLKGNELTPEQQAGLKAVSAGEALNLGVEIENEQAKWVSFAAKLKEHDEMAVGKYNSLLSDYKDYVNRVGIQLQQENRSNRISNALALYQMLPHYSPPQTINLNVTDCSKFPALCVH